MQANDTFSLDHQLCFALAAASRTVIALYRPHLEPLGLTHPQFLVMLALWDRSPRTVRDIGAALSLEPATLSPLLKRLESGGLLTRGRNHDDERALDVALTLAGQELRDRARAVPIAVARELGVSPAELQTTHTSITRLLGAASTVLAAR